MQIKIIVNPAAGKGRAATQLAILKPFLSRLPAEFEFAESYERGHAYELSKEAVGLGKYDVIVAMGGDGTVNEVANGLMCESEGSKRPALGVLPGGRGQDFCKATGVKIPRDLQEAARTLLGHNESCLDLGLVTFEPASYKPLNPEKPNQRYFINIGSLGFDAAVTQEANDRPRKFAPYYASIFAALRSYTNKQLTYKLDGQTHAGIFNSIVVANGNYYGSGMRIAPSADPRDGLFEIVTMGNVKKAEVVGGALLFYAGLHRYYPRIKILAGRELEIEPTSERIPIQLDGEVVGYTPAKFEIIPSAIRLKVP